MWNSYIVRLHVFAAAFLYLLFQFYCNFYVNPDPSVCVNLPFTEFLPLFLVAFFLGIPTSVFSLFIELNSQELLGLWIPLQYGLLYHST